MVMVEGENVLHHVQREGKLSGRGHVRGGICPGKNIRIHYKYRLYFCHDLELAATDYLRLDPDTDWFL